MKNRYYPFITAVIVIIGLLFFLIVTDFDRSSKIISAASITLMVLVFFVIRGHRISIDTKKGIPVEDEMTIKSKVYAGNTAFYISMILWFLIFIFNDIFTDSKTMLGIGILSSAAIYAVCLLYFKTTQNFSNPRI